MVKLLIIELLEVTRWQWLDHNVHVHDFITGDVVSQNKEELWQALDDQMEIGEEGLSSGEDE